MVSSAWHLVFMPLNAHEQFFASLVAHAPLRGWRQGKLYSVDTASDHLLHHMRHMRSSKELQSPINFGRSRCCVDAKKHCLEICDHAQDCVDGCGAIEITQRGLVIKLVFLLRDIARIHALFAWDWWGLAGCKQKIQRSCWDISGAV